MISFDLILVFVVILFILISFYKEILGPAFTFIIAVATLGIFRVLTPGEILSGFANEQIAVIIILLLLGNIIKNSAAIEFIFDRFFRAAKNYRGFLSRMMLCVAGFSAFLNNTPLVAIMMPYVHSWCNRNNISPSKFLMPLSFAAILGGCATLIGTSTNLIVNGLLVDQNIIPGFGSLNIFDFVYVGVPMILIGFFFLLFWGEKLLPSKTDIITEFSANVRKYIVEAKIRTNSHLIGKTIEEAGLRNLKGLFLVEIIRRSIKLPAISPDLILGKDDLLIFAGDTETIPDLITSNSGLALPEVGMLYKKKRTEIIEIVVSQNSTIINKNVKEINFRAKYDAAIISVHRNGEKISGKIGSFSLKAGDVLLLFAGENFLSRINNTQDFYFISKVKEFVKLETYKLVILLGGLFLAIILATFKIISLFMGLLILLLVSFALKTTNPKELSKSIDYNLGIIIVMSLALGIAMINTGAADLLANGIIRITSFMPLGKETGIIALAGIYLITAFLAAYITNKAAVAIIFPISLTISVNLELNPMPFILVVAYAAAANFMTPIGYQTNLMVYGPGGYNFKDFFRVGFPLTMIYGVVTVLILSLLYF